MQNIIVDNGVICGFESFVNSERCKTVFTALQRTSMFESFVNSERCKTVDIDKIEYTRFESFVNSERCKTV